MRLEILIKYTKNVLWNEGSDVYFTAAISEPGGQVWPRFRNESEKKKQAANKSFYHHISYRCNLSLSFFLHLCLSEISTRREWEIASTASLCKCIDAA